MTVCETAMCGALAVRYMSCEQEGSFPYCRECSDTLLRCGEVDRGPVAVPDEMVERAARWVFDHNARQDKLVRIGMIDPVGWDDVPAGCPAQEDAREIARGVLTVALNQKQTSQEGQ